MLLLNGGGGAYLGAEGPWSPSSKGGRDSSWCSIVFRGGIQVAEPPASQPKHAGVVQPLGAMPPLGAQLRNGAPQNAGGSGCRWGHANSWQVWVGFNDV